MKLLKRFLIGLVVIIVLAIVGLYFSGNDHLITAMPKTYLIGRSGPDIDDAKYFNNEKIAIGTPQPWAVAKHYNEATLSDEGLKRLEELRSVSYLVIENDEIVFEKYWEGYDKTTNANSFSMSKTIVSMTIGLAIDEGKIKSVEQKAAEFIPELANDERKDISIKQLLQMTSGIGFDESYKDPFGYMAKMNYGGDVMEKTYTYKQNTEPGSVWKYSGGNTLILADIVEKATGRKIHEYVAEKLWQPLGAETEALWSTDRDEEVIKAFCCFYSNARDFSRFGKLFLCHGNWEGNQIISPDYVDASLTPVILNDGSSADHYGYQWWMGKNQGMDFWAMRGLHGQYVIIVPEKELIICRMGHDRVLVKRDQITLDIYDYIDEGLKIIAQ